MHDSQAADRNRKYRPIRQLAARTGHAADWSGRPIAAVQLIPKTFVISGVSTITCGAAIW
jgi:hypothetical protein